MWATGHGTGDPYLSVGIALALWRGGIEVSIGSISLGTLVMFLQYAAFIENPAQEPQLIAAMKTGHVMTVQGTSRSGTQTTDSYSLSGVTAALDAIVKACPQ